MYYLIVNLQERTRLPVKSGRHSRRVACPDDFRLFTGRIKMLPSINRFDALTKLLTIGKLLDCRFKHLMLNTDSIVLVLLCFFA